MIYIYALVDPITDEVRYIGKSIHPSCRYTQHLNDKLYNPHKRNWIHKLKLSGLSPVLEILEELHDNDDWQQAEIEWIANTIKAGHVLTNQTIGGDGIIGESEIVKAARLRKSHATLMSRPDSRKRISDAIRGNKHMLGKKHSPEVKLKMSNSHKGKKFTADHVNKLSKILSAYNESDRGKARIAKFIAKYAGQKSRSKLSADDVRIIRNAVGSNWELAKRYNVSTCCISNARNYVTYKDVD